MTEKTRVAKLNAYLAQVRGAAFRPGAHDCGMFAAGWVHRVTGVDHGAEWRGEYRTMCGLAEMMRERGFEDHIAYVDSLFDAVPPAMAQPGDLAVVEESALGIVAQERIYVLRPGSGLGHVSRLAAKRAWRICPA